MKRSLFTLLSLVCLSLNVSAQTTDSFDISTFAAPKGWAKQVGQDAVQFSIEDASGICIISLFKSLPSLGSSKEDFAAAWSKIVKETVSVTGTPQMLPADRKGEWQVTGEAAPFESGGTKGVAMLFIATGHGRMVNALILTNTQAHEAAVTGFLNSVNFKTPPAAPAAQTPVSQNGQPSLTGTFWKQGSIRGGMLGHSSLSTGTFAKTYQFFSNGTYKFSREDMQLAAPKYYLEAEEGTYTVNGNTITLTPKKASFSQHRLKKEEPPIKSGKLPLTTVQYRFEFWRYDDNWRLLLSPVDGNETKRDGTFSFYRNGEAQRTYQYHLVDAGGKLIQ